MRLTTKARYAVMAMMELTLRGGKRKITLADVATSQDISLSYLEQLFAKLRRHGLVQGVRGPGGGYRLGRDAHAISVADIVTAVDEAVDVTRCKGRENCQDGERCVAHELWSDLSNKVYEFLDSISLGDLCERARTQQGTQPGAQQQSPRRVDVEPPAMHSQGANVDR
jgi:Rrf2 family iron-sulfur cluster assembly transcriptional regulator